MKSAPSNYFIARLLALLFLGGIGYVQLQETSEPLTSALALEFESFIELEPLQESFEIEDEPVLAPRRMSLSPELPPEPDKPAAPVIPLDAVSMRFQRWPDLAPLDGVEVQLVDTGRGDISQHVIPVGSRLRLADALREDQAAVHVRAEGYETLRVVGTPRGTGIEYLAVLRPRAGYYGRVVNFDGRPMADVQVRGFWAESPRPLREYQHADVLGPSVRERMKPKAASIPEGRLTVNSSEFYQANSFEPERPRSFDPDFGSTQRAKRPSLETNRTNEVQRGGPFRDHGTTDVQGPLHFLSAHAELSATAVTDADGWYYVEPLDGFVLGDLQLWADGVEGSSDILRVDLPQDKPRLPEIVVHRPRPIVVTVVGPEGTPIVNAKVIFKLAEGWSPEWPPFDTDEQGRVTFQAPAAELLVSVEKAAFKLSEPTVWRPASADRLFRQLKEITPQGQSARALYKHAYNKWRTPLPRARGFLAIDMWTSDVEASLEPAGARVIEVLDSEHDFPLINARVTVRHGGLDPGRAIEATDLNGRAVVALMDCEWQPMVLTVSSPGYVPRTFSLGPRTPQECSLPLRVKLTEERDGRLASDQSEGGLVTDARGPAIARVDLYDNTSSHAKRLWSGRSDAEGVLSFNLSPKPSLAVFALQTNEHTGLVIGGYSLGPLPSSALMPNDHLEVHLEAPVHMSLSLTALESGRPYRLNWTVRPFEGAKVLARGQVSVDPDHGGRFDLDLPLPADWILEAQVFGASVGHGPAMAFTQPNFDQPYASTRPTWDAWKAVSDEVSQKATASRRKLFLVVRRRVDLSGVVRELPYYPEDVYLAAMSSVGTWYSEVSGNGWFAFRELPVGDYRLVLYQRPNREQGPQLEHTPGDVHGTLKLELNQARHDAEITWIAR